MYQVSHMECGWEWLHWMVVNVSVCCIEQGVA